MNRKNLILKYTRLPYTDYTYCVDRLHLPAFIKVDRNNHINSTKGFLAMDNYLIYHTDHSPASAERVVVAVIPHLEVLAIRRRVRQGAVVGLEAGEDEWE